jgi:uncharacterized repeat protein (TIGR03803 family)
MRKFIGLNRSHDAASKLRSAVLAWVAVICFSALPTAVHAQTITQLFSFPCPPQQFTTCPEGYAPNVLMQASDGNFYGAAQLTTIGSSNPHGGSLFKITPSGQFTLLFTFAADSPSHYLNGDNPATGLVEANDGFLYGTTFEGGATNNGVLFRISKRGKSFQVVHQFCTAAHCADGGSPQSLILGHDGNLYGVTLSGGSDNAVCQSASGCGTIFRFAPATGLTTLFQFNGSTQGGLPEGLTQATDGNFYGTAGGEVFRFAPSGQFKILKTFPPVDGILPTNADSGLVQSSNGKLYGGMLTYSIDQAQFYAISPSGSGFREFPSMGTLAVDFRISTPILASDGNLWTAFTEAGSSSGSVMAISPSSGAAVRSFEFEGTNGSLPEAGVVQAADGKFYGTTTAGGVVSGSQQPSGTVWTLDAGLPAPASSVAAFNPAGGLFGARVLIRGSHFIGTTAVTFNGVNATFKVLNTNFISAAVPSGATSGPIAVTNAGGTTVSTGQFTVPIP